LKEVHIKIIPNDDHRYCTIGDWWLDKRGNLQIRVSKFEDERHSMLIAIHELFEAYAASKNHIPEPEVTKFDLWFDEEEKKGNIPKTLDEPGFHPSCPYNREHQYATAIEMVLATLLGCNWWEYDEAVRKLSRDQKIVTNKVDENGVDNSAPEE
jgi:hypothetical protein